MRQEIIDLEVVLNDIDSDGDPKVELAKIAPAFARAVGHKRHPEDELSASVNYAIAHAQNKRECALLALRLMEFAALLDASGERDLKRKLVELIEGNAPDLAKAMGIKKQDQTFESFRKFSGLWPTTTEKLSSLQKVKKSPYSMLAEQESVLRSLKSEQVQALLNPFDIRSHTGAVEIAFSRFRRLYDTADSSFPEQLESLENFACERKEALNAEPSFLTNRYLVPFWGTFSDACKVLRDESKDRFEADIELFYEEKNHLAKRYPLQEPGREIRLIIPFVNNGGGSALNTSFTVLAEKCISFNANTVRVGEIKPGKFSFAIDALTIEPTSEIELLVEVTWNEVGSTEPKRVDFKPRVLAQPTGIDWASLDQLDPYSTEVATGDEFVGRKNKINSLTGRLTKQRMESSYVTGQKRVGKSSLALAVRDRTKALPDGGNFRFLYLEWGEYSHATAEGTLRQLGEAIYEFLLAELDDRDKFSKLSFDGSLSPLIKVLNELERVKKALKFVIILDEFDSIHPELYRMGPLADTFFGNLRSLAAKSNIAFMLVGGEKMPFVISAQGDELNKFVREELSYFSRSDDWSDYCDLVRNPVANLLNWHEGAVNALFNYTNGHPYFTKLLCKRIFRRAVEERDADITETEVSRAYFEAISSLDVNSFSHIWKDGIKGSREEEEVHALKRCRVLVAIAQCMRSLSVCVLDNVIKYKRAAKMENGEVSPLLGEFCRRGILQEKVGVYEFVLPLFSAWLTEGGVNKLIADELGDELAEAIQKSEDEARVLSGEICDVVDNWGVYRGRRIGLEDVRAWLGQLKSHREQRILFKILSRIRFFTDVEVMEKLRNGHRRLIRRIPEYVRRVEGAQARSRPDIVVTYIDGVGKSGAEYAREYVTENGLNPNSVLELGKFREQLLEYERKANSTINAVVVVDDVIGTGDSLLKNIKNFLAENRSILHDRSAVVLLLVVASTSEGAHRVIREIEKMQDVKIEVVIGETLDSSRLAFYPQSNLWKDQAEQEEAAALCAHLGSKLSKRAPLGYAGQGLLVVFPKRVPNNSLPIFYARADKPEFKWRPLFRVG